MNQTDSELLIKLEPHIGQQQEDIPIRTFLAVTAKMNNVANEIDRSLGDGERQVEWVLSDLRIGSSIVGAKPRPIVDIPTSAATQRVTVIVEGIQTMMRGAAIRPSFWTDNALHNLSQAIRAVPKRLRLRVGYEHILHDLDLGAVVTINRWLEGKYTTHGSVEGRLDAILTHDRFQFAIYTRKGFRVACNFPEEWLPHVAENIRKKILVRGRITYRGDGVPTTIRISDPDDFMPLPERDALPQVSDVRGIWKTNMTAEEYLEALHGD